MILLSPFIGPTAPWAQAAEPLAFSLPADEGYGVGDCLRAESACGEVLATAWCQAHGHLKALAFGAADLTGSTPGLTAPAAEPVMMSIRCGD